MLKFSKDKSFIFSGPQERDSQRAKLYKADDILKHFAKPLPEIKNIEKYADKLFKMKRLMNKYPRASLRGRPLVKDGRGCRNATGSAGSIVIPAGWARQEDVVCHELAHCITDREFGWRTAGHGWQFCMVYLDVVKWMMGLEAHDALKASFKKSKVRFTKPAKRGLSAEHRATLSARMKRINAKEVE